MREALSFDLGDLLEQVCVPMNVYDMIYVNSSLYNSSIRVSLCVSS